MGKDQAKIKDKPSGFYLYLQVLSISSGSWSTLARKIVSRFQAQQKSEH